MLRLARNLTAALLILALIPAAGICRMKAGGMSLTPFLGAMSFDGEHNLSSGPYGGLDLAYYFGPALGARVSLGVGGGFEAGYYNSRTGRCDKDSGITGVAFHGDLLYDIPISDSFVPYLSAGLGGNWFSGSDHISQDKAFLGTWALGVKYALASHLDLRLELGQYLNLNDWNSDFSGTAGLSFLLGE